MKANRILSYIMVVVMVLISCFTIKEKPVSASDFTDFSGATLIESGKSVIESFELSETEEKVYFKFKVPKTGNVKLSFHTEFLAEGKARLYLGDGSYKEIESWHIYSDEDTKIGNTDSELIVLNSGTYYLVIENIWAWDDAYGKLMYPAGTVKVSYVYEDVGISTDLDLADNDSVPTATVWDFYSIPEFTGGFTFDDDDGIDFYKISIKEKNQYHFTFISPYGYWIKTYDSQGELIKEYSSYYDDAYGYSRIEDIYFDKGDYYIGVTGARRGGYYSLKLEEVIKEEQQNQSDNTKNTSSNNKTDNKFSNEWVNGKWYDANGNSNYKGKLVWKNNSSGWWVEDTSGWYPVNSWQKIDGVWYYFGSSGYMASNEYYGGYWFNSDGSWNGSYYLSWKSNATGWWVADKSGWWPSNKWLKIDGYWYYFNASGYMVTNQYIDGYWLGADGICY